MNDGTKSKRTLRWFRNGLIVGLGIALLQVIAPDYNASTHYSSSLWSDSEGITMNLITLASTTFFGGIVGAVGASLEIGDLGLDTGTPSGEFMLTVIAAVAQMERRVMLERQAIGIEEAKAKGKYKGRKPKVRQQADKIVKLAEEGFSKRQIAERLGCSIRSVFAVLADAK